MLQLEISKAEILRVSYEIIHCKCPWSRRRMLVILLKHLGLAHGRISELSHCHPNSVTTYIRRFSDHGPEGLLSDGRHGPEPGFAGLEEELMEALSDGPVESSAHAASLMEGVCGWLVSCSTALRWMRALGMRFRKPVAVPAKADAQAQAGFLAMVLLPLLQRAALGRCKVFFMDAAHFLHGPSTAACWSFARAVVKAPSGRKRHNVLAALDPVSMQVAAVTEAAYVNAKTVITLMQELRLANHGKRLHMVLDNARYQRCELVFQAARKLRIHLTYLPPYSPNLNLIERFWKLLRKRALNNRHHETFAQHRKAIDDFIIEVNAGRHQQEMNALITPNFQQFQDSQIAVV